MLVVVLLKCRADGGRDRSGEAVGDKQSGDFWDPVLQLPETGTWN